MELAKPTLILLIGIPASGKSTFARRYAEAGWPCLSLDVLHSRTTELRQYRQLVEKRCNILIDNTNVTISERSRYLAPAKAAGYRTIGYYFQSVIKDCLARNMLRTGKACVPQVGLIARAKSLELPSYAEEFDELYYVTIVENGFNVVNWEDEK